MSISRSELEALYLTYGSLVLGRARQIVRDEETARDAMQDVFVRALKCHDGFRQESSPATWLYRLTTNYCLNRLRDGKRRRELLREHASAPPAPGPTAPQTTALAVRQLLAAVPKELAAVAVYHYLDGMDQQEIAQVLQLSRRAVGHRLQRFARAARKNLGLELSEA